MRHIILQLHITSNCNLRCKHCYIDEHTMNMSLGDIQEVFSQFDRLGYNLQQQHHEPIAAHIHITGGEPFLHPEIDRILRIMYENRKKYHYAIMSNGTLINERILGFLSEMNLKAFQVSLDGICQTHDSIRGEGNYQKVLNALDLLYRYRINSRVSFTAHKENFREFPIVAQVCREHHVCSLWSDRYIPFSDRSLVKPLNQDEMNEYVQILQQERCNPENKIYNLSVQNNRALQFLYSDDIPYYCRAGETLITVDEKGNILPCRRMPIICGNIHTDSLSYIYFNHDSFIDLRKHDLFGKCIDCSSGKECKGGERCFTFAITGDYHLPDPCCWINKNRNSD